MASSPFCADCPDGEACSQGAPCELVKSLSPIDAKHSVPLVHGGRIVGAAEVDPDEQTITCKFDIKQLNVNEVVELFWIGMSDRIEINAYTPIGE